MAFDLSMWIETVLSPFRQYKKKESKAASVSTMTMSTPSKPHKEAHDQLAQSLEVRGLMLRS